MPSRLSAIQSTSISSVHSTIARPRVDAILDIVVRESQKVPARIWREALAGQINDDVTADLGRISVPTLIAWGDRDEIATRAIQETLAGAITGSRLIVHHGAGHAVHWDDAEAIAFELTAFVDGLATLD